MSVEASPRPVQPEAAKVAEVAEGHITKRRSELNKRLRKWGNWMIGGTAAALVGWGLVALGGPLIWVGVPLYLAGSIADTIGFVGIAGNVIKGLMNKNK